MQAPSSPAPTVVTVPPTGAAGDGAGSGVLLFLGFALLVLALRLAADRLDRARIREDLHRRGLSARRIEWSPFGRGWFGERGDRIYRVEYEDASGVGRGAECKTSMWSGVYWHGDAPQSGGAGSEVDRLRAENERLRRELEKR